MSILPRLAVGTIQPEVDSQPMVWGLLDAFAQAKRISAPQNQASVPVPPSVTPFFEPICSENYG